MNKEKILREHILECINGDLYEVDINTDEEKVNFLYNIFLSEYNSNIKNFKNREMAFISWTQGVPSSFEIFIYNDEILDFLKEKNIFNEDNKDSIEIYFKEIGRIVEKMFKEFKVEEPQNTKIIIANGKIKDNLFYLPPVQLDRKTYKKVADILNLMGGKWTGGKIQAFKFEKCPTYLIKAYLNGEDINFKKKFQFFPTPEKLSRRLVELAQLEQDDLVLEPSAGQGSIVKEINKMDITPDCFELMDVNREILEESEFNFNLIGDDFLKSDMKEKYNKIIANPPFSKNQDIKHVMKMFDSLKGGGRIVSMMSRHWINSSTKKCVEFRELLEKYNAETIEVDAGEFKESGTNIATVIVLIDK